MTGGDSAASEAGQGTGYHVCFPRQTGADVGVLSRCKLLSAPAVPSGSLPRETSHEADRKGDRQTDKGKQRQTKRETERERQRD